MGTATLRRVSVDLRDFTHLPGHDIVSAGLSDLAAGRNTANALLVAVAAPRLRSDGMALPEQLPANAKDRLWELLLAESGDDAHRRYNALLGRIVSFAAAYETLQTAQRGKPDAQVR